MRRAAIVVLLAGCSREPAPPTKAAPVPAKPVAPTKPAAAQEPSVAVADPTGWPIGKPALSQVAAGEDAVALVSAGAEPHAALRYAPEAGAVFPVELTMDLQVAMQLGVQAIDPSKLPTMRVAMNVTPGATEGGITTYDFTVTSSTREDLESASARLLKAMDTAVEGMKDATGTLSYDDRGRLTKADYGLPEVPTPKLRPSLAGFQQSFSQLFVVLPEEPVGVGATWTSTTHFELSGVPIAQTTTYTLTSRAGDELTIGVSFDQAATGDVAPPGGVALEGTRFGGRGTGSVTVGLSTPFPAQASAASRTRTESSVTMGGAAQPVEMDLLSTLTIARPGT